MTVVKMTLACSFFPSYPYTRIHKLPSVYTLLTWNLQLVDSRIVPAASRRNETKRSKKLHSSAISVVYSAIDDNLLRIRTREFTQLSWLQLPGIFVIEQLHSHWDKNKWSGSSGSAFIVIIRANVNSVRPTTILVEILLGSSSVFEVLQ